MTRVHAKNMVNHDALETCHVFRRNTKRSRGHCAGDRFDFASDPSPALPKSDNGRFESVYKIFLVEFGEGVRRTGGVALFLHAGVGQCADVGESARFEIVEVHCAAGVLSTA